MALCTFLSCMNVFFSQEYEQIMSRALPSVICVKRFCSTATNDIILFLVIIGNSSQIPRKLYGDFLFLCRAGIMSCVDGGSVVYSTCTLSPSQNDGVVQAALEYIWQETDINVSVVDLDYLARAFSDTFRFSKTCRFGQLVLPALSCNFGPMYICKLRKSNKAKIDSQITF